MIQKIFITILLICCCIFASSQNHSVNFPKSLTSKKLTPSEKLEIQLKNYKNEDAQKIDLYRKICREYIDVDNEKLYYFSKKMLRISNLIDDKNGKADAHNFLGIVEDINSHYEKAFVHYKKALLLAKSSNNKKLVASIGNNIGLLEWKKGNYKDALSYFFTSLNSAEKVGSVKLQGNISSNIGLVFQDLKQNKESLKWQKKALYFRLKNDDEYGLASTFTNIASAYSFLNSSDSAVYYQTKAINIQKKIDDDYGLGISYFNLATEYQSRDQPFEAIKLFYLSKNIREKIEDSLGLSFTYISLASSKLKIGNTNEALLYGERSLAIAKKINSAERIAANSKELSEIYDQTGNSQKALFLMKQYTAYHEDIFNREMNDRVADLTIKYEVEKKEKELSIAKLEGAESDLKSKQKNIYLALLASLFIFSLIIFRNYRMKSILQKKQMILKNELLQEQSHSKIQEQRLEISRDLHDSLGVQLTMMSSVLDGMQRKRADLDEKISEKIDMLSDFSKSSIAELRNTLWVMHKDEIFVEDLKFKMLNFIKNVSDSKEEFRIDFDFKFDENEKLNSKKAGNVFMIFREILNNALKYSDANRIKIDAIFLFPLLNLTISDNGIGFDLEAEKGKSHGLQNIKHRIKDLDGDFDLETSCGKGTKYSLKLNLADV